MTYYSSVNFRLNFRAYFIFQDYFIPNKLLSLAFRYFKFKFTNRYIIQTPYKSRVIARRGCDEAILEKYSKLSRLPRSHSSLAMTITDIYAIASDKGYNSTANTTQFHIIARNQVSRKSSIANAVQIPRHCEERLRRSNPGKDIRNCRDCRARTARSQ